MRTRWSITDRYCALTLCTRPSSCVLDEYYLWRWSIQVTLALLLVGHYTRCHRITICRACRSASNHVQVHACVYLFVLLAAGQGEEERIGHQVPCHCASSGEGVRHW